MKLVDRLAICRHEPLSSAVVRGDVVYAGSPGEATAKVRLDGMRIEWSVPSDVLPRRGCPRSRLAVAAAMASLEMSRIAREWNRRVDD
jgi:hypothetical protein